MGERGQELVLAAVRLEQLAFRLAAERHGAEGLERLRGALVSEQEGARTADSVGSRRSAADFHEIVTDLADNQLLRDLMQGIRSRVRWALSQHDDLAHVTGEHAELFEAGVDPGALQALSESAARAVDPRGSKPAPVDYAGVLSMCEAALLSARTGQPESPSTVARMAG